MDNKIYTSPESSLSTQPLKQGTTLKGVAWGTLTDIGGTIIFGIIAGVVSGLVLSSQGLSMDEISEIMINVDILSFWGISTIIIGLLISFYAGYVCAKRSGEKVISSTTILCLISSLFGLSAGIDTFSFIENTLLTILTIGAIVFGAYKYTQRFSNLQIEFENEASIEELSAS